MPCYERERRKFEVWKANAQEQKAQAPGGGYGFQKEKDDESNEIWQRIQQKRDDHIKALAELRRKLRETASESEKTRLRKEIEKLEDELKGFEDILEELTEFMRDVQRRTIPLPKTNE